MDEPRSGLATGFAGLSDEALFNRYQVRGDRAALAALFERYQDFAYRVAYGQCGRVDLAEEAVQEAFLQLARGGGRFKDQGPESFRAWFYGVTMNQARNLRRVEQRVLQRNLQAGSAGKPVAPENTAAMNAELRFSLGRALEDLQEDLRLPVLLHCVEGLTQAQVGKLMGVSQSLVARRVAEGLDLLRKRLAQTGVTLSVGALPACLRDSGLFQASEGLRGALQDVCARAAQSVRTGAVRSVRRGAARESWLGHGAAAAVLLAAGVAAFFALQPSQPDAPPAAAAAPQAASKPEPAPEPKPDTASDTAWTWDFNAAPEAEFVPRKIFMRDAVRPNFELPVWQPRGGRADSGAMKFAAPGGSLIFKTGISSAQLPIRFEFDMLLLDARDMKIGVAQLRSKPLPPAAKVTPVRLSNDITWQTGAWVHVVRLVRLEKDTVISESLYNGERKADYLEESFDPAWSDPECLQYFELYGHGFCIDNLKITCGPPGPRAGR